MLITDLEPMEEPFAEVVVPLEVGVVGRGGEEVLEVVEDEEGAADAHGDAVHGPLELQLAAVVATAPVQNGTYIFLIIIFLKHVYQS